MESLPSNVSDQLLPSPIAEEESAGQTARKPWWRRRYFKVLVAVGAVLAVVVALMLIPMDKVIESPGPTWNVIAAGEADVLEVTGTQTYETDGALRMTTVSVRGCPGYPVSVMDVLLAQLDENQTVLDRDLVCPDSLTEEDMDQISQTQMTSSQSSAVVAALMETGLATEQILTISGAGSEDTDENLQTGDILQAVQSADGEKVELSTFTQLKNFLTQVDPGSTLTITALRDGEEVTYPAVTLSPSDEDAEGSILGVYLSVSADSEIDAEFSLEDVGGPSAGMMFALGIVDEVTPGALTGGLDIAGTGTIDPTGTVGEIGGIAQKMAGAAEDGATVFLAPSANCEDVVGNVPEGLDVYAVSTLHEAVTTVEAVADGDTESLQICEQVVAQADSSSED